MVFLPTVLLYPILVLRLVRTAICNTNKLDILSIRSWYSSRHTTRMASQLIVKSQAAIAWNGKTIWVLQDLLADYISSSTALDLRRFIAEHTNEVNILAFSYGDDFRHTRMNQTVSLNNSILYAGPIRANSGPDQQPCFQDIVLASVCPPRQVLISALSKKQMANRITV